MEQRLYAMAQPRPRPPRQRWKQDPKNPHMVQTANGKHVARFSSASLARAAVRAINGEEKL